MKPIVLAPVGILLLAPGLARAQDVHVYKDQQGVETYTNVPASRRTTKPPKKDEDGAQVYSNLPASGVRKPSAASADRQPQPQEEGQTLTVVPASRMQEPPPPPNDEAQRAPSESGVGAGSMPAAPSGSDGQWVFTQQYGWVWMPYDARYTSEGSSGDETPYAYVYEPSEGWTWCAAPWVWGWGAYPYFGARGPGRFGWYKGLMHAGYGWGSYRGGGPGRTGLARSASGGHLRSGSFGRGFASGHVGARFRSGGGFHGSPAAHSGFSHGGSFGGGHAGGGFSGGHGGGGHAGGGHGGGGRR